VFLTTQQSPTECYIQTVMININSHGHDKYLPILIKCCHFAFKCYCISKTIRCFWLTLYNVFNTWTYWFCIKQNGMNYMETKDPISLESVLRNPDMLVWVANFFHAICQLNASPTKKEAHSSEMLSPSTKCHNPDAQKKTSNIKHNYTTIFPQTSLTL